VNKHKHKHKLQLISSRRA